MLTRFRALEGNPTKSDLKLAFTTTDSSAPDRTFKFSINNNATNVAKGTISNLRSIYEYSINGGA
jgi:hypothetical protein